MQLLVTASALITPWIRSLELADPQGAVLPSFAPGSHLIVHAGAARNAYSLTSEGTAPRAYRISVLRCDDGAGGSRWLHGLAVGDRIEVERPRSAFAPVSDARHHLLVAGGVGITPLLSHVRAARRWGRSFRLIYGYRPGYGAHLEELRALAGGCLEEHVDRTTLMAAVGSALRSAPLGTHLYVCGPAALLDRVRTRAVTDGWPDERIHEERFSAEPADPGREFMLRLKSIPVGLRVAPGQSILDRLTAEGVQVPHLCRRGFCGECRLVVRSGVADHRDHYLSPDERSAGTSVMACVSRASTDELEVEL